ncbi:MAG: hypothetical protein K2N44_06475 [Lachnospiraceae bacterium]|nr:hypothetical protein [Lachnospiraceae bacterium]
MDQIIGERETERTIIDRIKTEYDIVVRHEESDNRIVFSMQNDGIQSMLELVPRVAAMRRNPPNVSAGRLSSMADIARVETNRISAVSTEGGYHTDGVVRKLISGALAYQNQMRVPVCLVKDIPESFPESDNFASKADFFENFGFQYIYDRPHYVLNTETISAEMLGRAAGGETVSLDIPNMTLQAVAREDMLSLAHFANARICRQYGFFTIRSASYYEHVQKILLDSGGNLFQVMENGIRKGFFACTNAAADSIREVVFDQDFDKECYLLTEKGENPAVMARIVNMSEMLRHVAGDGRITIAIRLRDPMIAENDGLFIWYIDERGSRMERVEEPVTDQEKDSSMRPEVTTTIGEFTAFIFEYMKLKQNAKFDSIYLAGPAFINEMY